MDWQPIQTTSKPLEFVVKWLMAHARCLAIIVLLFGLLRPVHVIAQDLEPRAFSNTPVGMNFLAAAYAYSFGNILFDPSVPLEDTEAHVNSITLGYVRAIRAALPLAPIAFRCRDG